MLSVNLNEVTMESMQGKTLTIKVSVTNFLGNIGYNSTNIAFSTSRKIAIIDSVNSLTLEL
jgi:hypothetical protein